MRKKITTLPLQILAIEEEGYHLFVKGKVNGKVVRLLVDTGASMTVFDRERIIAVLDLDREEPGFEMSPHLSAGLGTNTMESHLAELKRFTLGELEIRHFTVAVLPIDHVNQSYEMLGYEAIDGVLGSDLLKRFDAVIYYKKKILKLYFD